MNERRKIIIQTGANPDEPLSSPHFDAEATLTARPVVPLSEQEAFQRQYGGYAGRAATPFWKRPALIALIVLSAIGIGVAAGLAIGIYKSRQNAQAPIVSAPPSTVENPKVVQTVEQPAPTPLPPIPRVTVPEKPVETPVEPKDEERAARNERKDKDEEVTPPVVRDKKRDKKTDDNDDQVLDERQAERERRRDERRERRRRQREEEAIDVPRGIERAGKEVNRIREIFEGRQP